jgi:hypothetical protein
MDPFDILIGDKSAGRNYAIEVEPDEVAKHIISYRKQKSQIKRFERLIDELEDNIKNHVISSILYETDIDKTHIKKCLDRIYDHRKIIAECTERMKGRGYALEPQHEVIVLD